MVKTYSGTESLADNEGSTDKNVQAAVKFWARIKDGAVRVVQVMAKEPKHPPGHDQEGELLLYMKEFQKWFREHKNARKDPWTDPEG